MASGKTPVAPLKRRPKARVVPVRVVSSPKPRRPVAPPSVQPRAPRAPAPPSAPTREQDRRVVMWVGVVLAAAIVFVVWIGFVQSDLARSTNSDSLFSKLRTEIQNIFSFGKKPAANVNAEEEQLNTLRERVFPDLKSNVNSGTFTTNTNADANQNSNLNSNLNTSLNTNRP